MTSAVYTSMEILMKPFSTKIDAHNQGDFRKKYQEIFQAYESSYSIDIMYVSPNFMTDAMGV